MREAVGLIMAGRVCVNGTVCDKPGTRCKTDILISVRGKNRFASRAGYKLDTALDKFSIQVSGRICADVGSSTGGFTDVLLQRNAAQVFAIDPAYGELALHLRNDARVAVMERCSVQDVPGLPQPIDFVSIDVSLIGLASVFPMVTNWLVDEGDIVCLVKPQYEALPEELPPGAVVRNPELHARIIHRVIEGAEPYRLFPHGVIRAPITGTGGNIEFPLWLKKSVRSSTPIIEAVESACNNT